MKSLTVKQISMLESVCKNQKVSAHLGATSIKPVLIAGLIDGCIDDVEGISTLLRFVRMNREVSTTSTFPEMIQFFGDRLVTVGVKSTTCIPAYKLWVVGKTYADLESVKVA